MISITIVIAILFIHWVADFLCQTDWMATNKSKNNEALLFHTAIYTAAWMPFCIILLGQMGILFLSITLICHTVQDYFTSRLNSRLWEQKKVHWFFVSIGFDQFLHFTQLLLTYYLLIKL